MLAGIRDTGQLPENDGLKMVVDEFRAAFVAST